MVPDAGRSNNDGMRPPRLLAAVLVTAIITTSTTPSIAQPATQVWAARAATHVFPDSLPTDTGAGTTLALDSARNEFEAGQVVIRRDRAFTIKRVSFSPLTSGFRAIPPSELSYNFVKFTALNHNSVFGGNQYVYAPSPPRTTSRTDCPTIARPQSRPTGPNRSGSESTCRSTSPVGCTAVRSGSRPTVVPRASRCR
ncbi:hypothetical protein GCM10029976_062620 [Kribbella albertanoniae]